MSKKERKFKLPELNVDVVLMDESTITGAALQSLLCFKPKVVKEKSFFLPDTTAWTVDFGIIRLDGELENKSSQIHDRIINSLIRRALDHLIEMYTDDNGDGYITNDRIGIITTTAFTSVDDLRDLEPQFGVIIDPTKIGENEREWDVNIRYDGVALIDCLEFGDSFETAVGKVKENLSVILDEVKEMLK